MGIMDRETYPKKWGMGPHAMKKKKLVTEGKLDKYGNPNENTPKDYLKIFGDKKEEPKPVAVEETVDEEKMLKKKKKKVVEESDESEEVVVKKEKKKKKKKVESS